MKIRPGFRLAAVGFSAVLSLTATIPAAAAAPTHTSFTFSFVGIRLDSICAFPIYVSGNGKVDQYDFLDNNGLLTKSLLPSSQQDSYTSTTKSLAGNLYSTFAEERYDATGKTIAFDIYGVLEDVTLPNGGRYRPVGYVNGVANPGAFVLTPDRGYPGDVAGFCAALKP